MYSESPGASPSVQLLPSRSLDLISTGDWLPAPLATRGVRARLGFSRPYHAFFRANIIIHQISSVPFNTGEFGVRWRFKDVHSLKEGQLLGSNFDSPHTPARGITPFIKLNKYTVTWSYTLNVLLKFGIDRETAQMSPSPLKLVVLQRVNDGAPQTSRLGAVYLDLAQFVGHGSVQRWYLLRESKTNTIMKLTLEMEYISGETRYVPPPLGQPEIKGIMDISKKDPPNPVRYDRAQRELHEYVAAQMAEVIAEHQVESPKVEVLPRPGLEGLEEPDEQLLEESHFEIYEQESHFEVNEQTSPPLVVFEHDNTNSPRSRTSSNSSYASAQSTMSMSESIYRDDISLYSIASSRTADTDYGIYYRRMALSQSTIDSERTTELRKSRSWTPSTVHHHN